MTSKRSNTACAKMGRDIAPGVPAQKAPAMTRFTQVDIRASDGRSLDVLAKSYGHFKIGRAHV